MSDDYRAMTPAERDVLDLLLEPPFQGRDALRMQARTATVWQVGRDGSLEFAVSSEALAYVESRVVSEGQYNDADGVTAHVLLLVLAGSLSVLEFYKGDGSQVLTLPSRDLLRVHLN